MKCKNCEEEIKEGWKTCPACGADLSKGKYNKAEDALDKLTGRINKIDEFLTEKFPVEPPKEGGKENAPKGKKRTLFGD